MKILVFFAILACSLAPASEKQQKWKKNMDLLAATFGELLPLLSQDQSNSTKLEKGALTLSKLAHSLEMGRKTGKSLPTSDMDPSLLILSEKFSETAKQAYQAIHMGQTDYGKGLLRSISVYCISCHTRHDGGPDFPSFPLNVDLKHLSTSEKATFYLSTRQFDKGISELQSLINDSQVAKKQAFAWDRSIRQALAVAVRVKKDPALAGKIIDEALSKTEAPEFTKEMIKKWKASVETWKNEEKKGSEAASTKELDRLIQLAKSNQNGFDHGGEIEYLRASMVAHEILSTSKDSSEKVLALWTAGMIYEALQTPGFWPMHELWYQACIREQPHSDLAVKCYNRLEESIYFGYTGSAGTNIPGDVEKMLKQMRALAVSN